jgi:hypothetical protein
MPVFRSDKREAFAMHDDKARELLKSKHSFLGSFQPIHGLSSEKKTPVGSGRFP